MGIYDGGGQSAQFPKIGTEYEGEVLSYRETQQKDMDTGKLVTWEDGSPKMMGVWTLDAGATGKWEDRTGDGDWVHVDVEDDDGVRTVYASGGLHTAIGAALRKAKVRGSDSFVGGTLRVKLIRTEKSQTKGYRPRKIFEAEFTKGEPKPDGVYADKTDEDDDFSV